MTSTLHSMLSWAASQRPIAAQTPEALSAEVSERLQKTSSLELVSPGVQLGALAQVLEGTKSRWSGSSDPAKSDGLLSPLVHAALRINPKTAAHRGFWLSLAHVPLVAEYLFARWPGKDSHAPAENHLSGDYSHQGLARLWWMAELLRDGPDYSFVPRGFDDQNVPNQAFRSLYFYSRPFAKAFVESVLEYHNNNLARYERGKRVDQSAKAVNAALGTVLLESICSNGAGAPTNLKEWTRSSPEPKEVKEWLVGVMPTGPQGGTLNSDDLRRAKRWMGDFYREWDPKAFAP